MSNIGCLDLKGQHAQIKDEIFASFEKVYAKTAFSGGPFVEQFEKEFASFCETEYSVGCNNGTNALHLALMALEVGEGDEVIIPANTFIATAWAVTYVGAEIIFVDCLPDTWEMDPEAVKSAITPNTKAIIGVHLYGCPCDVVSLSSIAKENDLFFLEDAAQAQGAKVNGKRVGGFGDISCFSFYPGKNLGACGEGGGITTDNKDYIEKLHMLRNHGCKERYYHDIIGYNMRMGGLEGASLSVKLKYLDSWNSNRIKIANEYFSKINNPKIQFQIIPEGTESVFHILVVLVEDRDVFVKFLSDHGINAAFHYPVPCHLQRAYANLGHKEGDFPHSERLASHCVSLPMYAELEEAQVQHVINVVNKY